MDLSDYSRTTGNNELTPEKLPDSPVQVLGDWLNMAMEQGIPEYNAMVLSTVSSSSRPSSRVVLLKDITDEGALVFFTNYQSKKGEEIKKNRYVSLNFHWREFGRQVRIEGFVQKTKNDISKTYFDSRPIESRISAIASPQSSEIETLDLLREKAEELKTEEVMLPKFWGGYQVVPDYFEFWQSGKDRLHDRIIYMKDKANWIKKRLAP